MRFKFIATIFICICSFESLSQTKYPVYILGSKILNLDSTMSIQVFQFFSDSTFSLINYQTRRHNISKSETKGRYWRQGDTLFLNDANSIFYPSGKNNYIKDLAEDERMQLFPAKIIMQKEESQFASYLNIPKKIYTSAYGAIIKLDQEYKRKQKRYEETRMYQF